MVRRGCFRYLRVPLATSVAILLATAPGCSERRSRQVHEAGEDRKVHVRLAGGPLDELTVLRDTDGRLVVAGVCLFPEGTRLNVSLADSAGNELGRTQAVVERALIHTLPLGPPGPESVPRRLVVRLEATFAPGLQSEPVLRALGDGARYQGEGMTRTLQGRIAYDRSFEVRL